MFLGPAECQVLVRCWDLAADKPNPNTGFHSAVSNYLFHTSTVISEETEVDRGK
jgi:hypothetical protein